MGSPFLAQTYGQNDADMNNSLSKEREREMTIQEAIRSGKPFKRRLWKFWHSLEPFGFDPSILKVEYILATDWEVKP